MAKTYKASLLSVYDENGNKIPMPAIRGDKPVKGVDYFTEQDKAEIIAAVLDGIGTPVFGTVDENNNIVLTGTLPDGTYSIKYKMEEGDTINIGNLVLDTNTYYSVTNNLTNCTNSNSANEAVEGGSYSATISANSGYELKSVTVTMGGASVSVSGGSINIASVTGDIVITAVAEETAVEIVNQIPISTDTSGAVYNGTGYKTDTRLNSSGLDKTLAGYSVTGFIPAKTNDKVYMENMYVDDVSGNSRMVLYDASKTYIRSDIYPAKTGGEGDYTDEGNGIYSYTITDSNVAFIRLSVGLVMDGSEVITINQPIV